MLVFFLSEAKDGMCWLLSPDGASAHGALHAVQATQLGQFAAPALQLVDASLQVVCQLAELLHRSHVLHEDTLLEETQSHCHDAGWKTFCLLSSTLKTSCCCYVESAYLKIFITLLTTSRLAMVSPLAHTTSPPSFTASGKIC